MKTRLLFLLMTLVLSVWLVVDHWRAPQIVKGDQVTSRLQIEKRTPTPPPAPGNEPQGPGEVLPEGNGSHEPEELGAVPRGVTPGSSNEQPIILWPNDPEWLEQTAESLRQNGMDEKEIQTLLESMMSPGDEEDFANGPPMEEMSPEQMREEVRLSLLEAGLPPDDVDLMVEDIVAQLQGKLGKPRPVIPPSP
jgi:hypothetical protein